MHHESTLSRRLGDDVSPVNERVWDAARAVTVAIRLIDHLGLAILHVEVDDLGRKRIQIAGDPDGRLHGNLVGVVSINGNRHYRAERYGIEIVWVVPGQGDAA